MGLVAVFCAARPIMLRVLVLHSLAVALNEAPSCGSQRPSLVDDLSRQRPLRHTQQSQREGKTPHTRPLGQDCLWLSTLLLVMIILMMRQWGVTLRSVVACLCTSSLSLLTRSSTQRLISLSHSQIALTQVTATFILRLPSTQTPRFFKLRRVTRWADFQRREVVACIVPY